MKSSFVLAGILMLVLLSAAQPVQAFTAKNLDIAVQDNTDAVITFTYDLTWYEHAAVFMRIADPGNELNNALESSYGKTVMVTKADGSESRVVVSGFASKQENDNTVIMTTPALSFGEGEKILNQYWFARFISPDFSPEVTVVRFPDGYAETFSNQISIPAIVHTLGA